jgi:hypothetical protein
MKEQKKEKKNHSGGGGRGKGKAWRINFMLEPIACVPM